MKPVHLIFARKPAAAIWLMGHAPSAPALAALLLLGAIGCLAAVLWQAWETQQQIHIVQNAAAALHLQTGQAARQTVSAGKQMLTLQQSRDWNQIARQLNTPWPAILDALESSTPETVGLVTIEPDPLHGSVRLQVEAKTLDALLRYAQTLNTTVPFQEVVLLKHETNEQDVTRPMRLSLDARLKPRNADPVAEPEEAR
jgi:hypothetical protein